MAALTQVVPIESRRRPLTEAERLRAELDAARVQIDQLTSTVADQAKALAELTEEVPPWAPSLAILYWLYGPTRWHSKSWVSQQNRLKPLIRLLGDLPAAKLSPLVWSQHVAVRMTEPHYKGGTPSGTLLNLELGRAKQLLNWGVENKFIKFNPLLSAKPVSAVSRRETWLPLPDIDRLLDTCNEVVDKRRPDGEDNGLRGRVLRAFVCCCHDSMLRFGEALQVVHNPERIGEDGRFELAARTTKGNKRRAVFLTPRTVEAVRELPPVKVARRTLSNWFRELCRIAGVDSLAADGERQIRPHDLRASGASTADENGARATAIRDAMGHSRIKATEVYLRSGQAENARAASNVMARSVAGELSKLSAPARPRRAGRRKAVL